MSLGSRIALPLLLLGLAIAGVLGMQVLPEALPGSLRRAEPSGATPAFAPSASAEPPRPASAPAAAPDAPASPASEGKGLEPADVAAYKALADALRRGTPMGAAEVEAVSVLLSRHPEDKELVGLAEGVLVRAADGLRRARRYTEAGDLLRRAIALKPASLPARRALLSLLLETSDWTAAEAAARELLALVPGDAGALRGLGFALMRQDRNKEAVEALRASLEAEEDEPTRQMLAHVLKAMRDEQGMSEKQIAHFHVRYDGDEHEDVGREILRALERHHSTLSGVFDHRPSAPIAVILFSRQAYYDAAGAPRWSGGVYNHLDGRIRIPIGGLTSSLTPDIDDVLAHEVTHAFVHDLSRGVCPRDVNEGLAQYMEGKRVATAVPPDALKALADGRLRGVNGFYWTSLAFVEHLMGQRGQGGMNDLLRAMGETGDVNAAFRQVYGQDHTATVRAFADRFRLQY